MTNEIPLLGSGRIENWSLISQTDDESKRAAADYLGEGSGCPIRQELISKRGADTMIARYREVNMWYWNIIELIRSVNPELAESFERPTVRPVSEPIGKYEPAAVPPELRPYMVGIGHPLGYAIPRAIIEIMQPFQPNPQTESEGDQVGEQNALLFVQNAVLECARESRTTMNFTLHFLDRLAFFVQSQDLGGNVSRRILHHMVSRGKMEEDNCFGLYHHLINTFKRRFPAPYLSATYNGMTTEERRKSGIVDPLDLPVYVRSDNTDHRSRMVLVIHNQEDPRLYQIERRMEIIESVEENGQTRYDHVKWITHTIPTLYDSRESAITAAREVR